MSYGSLRASHAFPTRRSSDLGHALEEGGVQTRGAIAHIVADDHALRAFRAHEASERGTNVTDEALIDLPLLVTDHTPDVVGLDDGVHGVNIALGGLLCHIFS